MRDGHDPAFDAGEDGLGALVAGVAVRVARCPPEAFDDEVAESLGDVLELTAADRCAIVQVAPGPVSTAQVTHSASRTGLAEARPAWTTVLAWARERLAAGEAVDIVAGSPHDAERRAAAELGLASALIVPLLLGGELVGFLALGRERAAQRWTRAQATLVRMVADVVASGLARRRLEAALRESELLGRLTGVVADAGSWAWDPATDEVEASAHALAQFGVPPGARPSLGELAARMVAGDREAFVAHAQAALRGTEESRVESRVALDDGSMRYVATVVSPGTTSGGRAVLRAASADITARRDVEEALARNERQHRAFVTNAPVAVLRIEFEPPVPVSLDEAEQVRRILADGTIAQCNDAAAELYGVGQRDVLVGRAVATLCSHPEPTEATLQFVRRGYVAAETEERHRGDDGETRWSVGSTVGSVENGQLVRAWIVRRDMTELRRRQLELGSALGELDALRAQLHRANLEIRREAEELDRPTRILGGSPAIVRTLRQIESVAPTGASVLVHGETGTGKDLLASAIHERSPRRERPMVRVNCAAIPSSLIESELFGREKGAYTGAVARQVGRFEMADKSTIFLDEIGELPLESQGKLLHVLQEREIERLGSPRPIKVDVRVIAATNKDLGQLVREGRFREDLYYRLNVFPIFVPPLRDRLEDVPLLAAAFTAEIAAATGKRIEGIAPASLRAMEAHPWPGNVRELRNVIERAVILARSPILEVELTPAAAAPEPAAAGANQPAERLADAEREHVLRVLERTGWRVRGAGGAAEILGLKPTTLESRMGRLGIQRPR